MLLDLASDVYQVLELSWLPRSVSRLGSFYFFLREHVSPLILFAIIALTAILGTSVFFQVRRAF